MHAIDVTRHLHQPGKHYSGLLHYQGSVATEADSNEQGLLAQDETRRILTDLLCSAGSPDEGFRIGALAPVPAGYDFALAAGVFYLGGLRLDIEAPERFRRQTDFLQMRQGAPVLANNWLDPALDAVPAAPPVSARTDLVWLEAWEQAVTGAEDEETIEKALAVEASARLRPMRKVHLFPDTPAECDDAFQVLVDRLEADGRFSFDHDTAELRSQRRLTVDFVDTAPPADACAPPVRRGYLGAENATIQIRVIAPTRFAWSFGNAAPLYRCRLQPADILRFESAPRDAFMCPLVGDMIELIRCDSILPNGEFIGERHGLFYRVATNYDPDTGTVGLANGPTAGPFFNETAVANDLAAALQLPGPGADFFYARVWRGETIVADPIGQNMAAAPAWTILGNTGIRVRFSGNGPVGDSWTFSARPHTPDVIVPWEMRRPCPPSGPRRFIAALGLIRWRGVAGAAPDYHDCRRRIRKLERVSGCCEVTVGDGHQSHGDAASIAEALARLPASGGKICLLRGTHRENVLIEGRRDIVIEGCGPLARLEAGVPDDRPVIGIRDSQGITIRNFTIAAPRQVAIAIDDDNNGRFGDRTRGITVDSMQILSRDAPALVFNGGQGLALTESSLLFARLERRLATSGAAQGTSSMVVLLGRDMRVERCLIAPAEEPRSIRQAPDIEAPGPANVAGRVAGPGGVSPAAIVPVFLAGGGLPLGGIHVLGGSEQVEIRRNLIAHGTGTGIVLGSVTMVPAGRWVPGYRLDATAAAGWSAYRSAENLSAYRIGQWVEVTEEGCIRVPRRPPDLPGEPDRPLRPDADPFIIGMKIIENEISDMGECGIAPFAQFDLARDRQYCGVADLLIRGNRISRCTTRAAPAPVAGERAYTARGGVVLGYAEGLDFTDNEVRDCGAGRIDPVCGFFAAALAHARIARNRIRGNGRRVNAGDANIPLGQRGGIVIRYVQPSVRPLYEFRFVLPNLLQTESGGDALLVQENQVSSPEGRALQICGIGGISVTGNQLVSLGGAAAALVSKRYFAVGNSAVDKDIQDLIAADLFPSLFGNLVVSVLNLGRAGDFDSGSMALGPAQQVDAGGGTRDMEAVTTGRLLFANNQTRFDGLQSVPAYALSLVGLASMDDARMIGNQCDSDFSNDQSAGTHGLVIGATANMSGNRFSERQRGDRALSGVCVGWSAFMHHNFGTHCFTCIGFDQWSESGPNHHLASTDLCRDAVLDWTRTVTNLLFRPTVRYMPDEVAVREDYRVQGGQNA